MIAYGTTTRKNQNIPNGVLIGGVANFYSSAKPTNRVGGSALVIGDLWFNPINGIQGFWNGTYWLNLKTIYQSNNNYPIFEFDYSTGVLIRSLTCYLNVVTDPTAINTSTNYNNIVFRQGGAGSPYGQNNTVMGNNQNIAWVFGAGGYSQHFKITPNIVLSRSAQNTSVRSVFNDIVASVAAGTPATIVSQSYIIDYGVIL